ncbi:hypothetical protein UCREL1_4747 [Eutypa lata UCREL1]|uniref:Uncharacterized protein n=1 Tax=Eutypa lata (strain UCR-EL1) TaxID=1287681 RepID=M7SP96_EUTLA|nr:hypothetical protein UCREL1_4747 [Eutypa lata UCREL1]
MSVGDVIGPVSSLLDVEDDALLLLLVADDDCVSKVAEGIDDPLPVPGVKVTLGRGNGAVGIEPTDVELVPGNPELARVREPVGAAVVTLVAQGSVPALEDIVPPPLRVKLPVPFPAAERDMEGEPEPVPVIVGATVPRVPELKIDSVEFGIGKGADVGEVAAETFPEVIDGSIVPEPGILDVLKLPVPETEGGNTVVNTVPDPDTPVERIAGAVELGSGKGAVKDRDDGPTELPVNNPLNDEDRVKLEFVAVATEGNPVPEIVPPVEPIAGSVEFAGTGKGAEREVLVAEKITMRWNRFRLALTMAALRYHFRYSQLLLMNLPGNGVEEDANEGCGAEALELPRVDKDPEMLETVILSAVVAPVTAPVEFENVAVPGVAVTVILLVWDADVVELELILAVRVRLPDAGTLLIAKLDEDAMGVTPPLPRTVPLDPTIVLLPGTEKGGTVAVPETVYTVTTPPGRVTVVTYISTDWVAEGAELIAIEELIPEVELPGAVPEDEEFEPKYADELEDEVESKVALEENPDITLLVCVNVAVTEMPDDIVTSVTVSVLLLTSPEVNNELLDEVIMEAVAFELIEAPVLVYPELELVALDVAKVDDTDPEPEAVAMDGGSGVEDTVIVDELSDEEVKEEEVDDMPRLYEMNQISQLK